MLESFSLGLLAQSALLLAALAAGGIVTMLTTSVMPFSWERGGCSAGTTAVVGFALSYLGV